MSQHGDIYSASRKAFGKATRAFMEAQRAYRSREIGDDAFLTARRAWKDAEATFDRAESDYIQCCNTLGVT